MKGLECMKLQILMNVQSHAFHMLDKDGLKAQCLT